MYRPKLSPAGGLALLQEHDSLVPWLQLACAFAAAGGDLLDDLVTKNVLSTLKATGPDLMQQVSAACMHGLPCVAATVLGACQVGLALPHAHSYAIT